MGPNGRYATVDPPQWTLCDRGPPQFANIHRSFTRILAAVALLRHTLNNIFMRVQNIIRSEDAHEAANEDNEATNSDTHEDATDARKSDFDDSAT